MRRQKGFLIPPAAQVSQNVDIYWETWTAHQQETDRLNSHVSEPKVGVMRQVVVADTDEEALVAAQEAHSDRYRAITKLAPTATMVWMEAPPGNLPCGTGASSSAHRRGLRS